MNSRERAVAALSHKEPDRVPVDLAATTVTSIARPAYASLRLHLGMEPDPDPLIANRQMGIVYPRSDLLEHYEIDFRPVNMKSPWGFKVAEMPDDSFYDEFGIRWKRAGNYYDIVEFPLAGCTTNDLLTATWPDPADPGRAHGLREDVKALYLNTDTCIVAGIMCGGPFEQACCLRGFQDFCLDLHLDARFAEALLDRITDTDLALWDIYLDAVGEFAQVVCQGDDVGMQTGLFISPAMWRRLIKPRLRRIFDFVHSRTDARIFLHTCGSVYDIIGDLIEIGVDILNPVQRSAARMDIQVLKREFGNDICFWGGGVDVQQFLPFASRQEIETDIKRTVDIMAPGGGFVFAACHNIQADVTPDRIDAVYSAALRRRVP